MVAEIAPRSFVGNSTDNFFELTNSHFYIIDNRVYLGPIARGKNYSSAGVRRESIKVALERARGDGNGFQVFNWRAVDI